MRQVNRLCDKLTFSDCEVDNMNNFNPFDYLNEMNFNLNFDESSEGVEEYIRNLLGPDFWNQVLGNNKKSFKSNVFQTNDEVIILVNVPGLHRVSDINIVRKGLTLFLTVSVPTNTAKTNVPGFQENNQSRKFTQRINLPVPVKKNGVKAVYKDNVLEIKLLKENVLDEQKIEVMFL